MEAARKIGDYRIVGRLGKGGMSEVFEAEHVRLGTRHAVKCFTYGKDVEGVRERFLVEGRLLATLSHPRIVRVTDFGVAPDTNQPYFVMDVVTDKHGKARSLADVIDDGVDEAQIATWYDDLREGLQYIHSKGIVHRDLKLENILIGPDGHVVLTDFGISKVAGCADDGTRIVDPVQTVVLLKDGKRPVMGSIGYMAPELEMGVAASPESDYYALGVVVFRLLTGMWCDARTDVIGALETYDPVWRQIVPSLLHTHPQGRKCLSWRELKDLETDRQLDEIRRARRLAVLCAALTAVAVCGVIVCVWRDGVQRVKLAEQRAELAVQKNLPTFDELFALPKDAPEDDSSGRATREALEIALPDAWMLAHEIVEELYRKRITRDKAMADMEKMAGRARQEDQSLFDGFPNYIPNGEYGALAELLTNAVQRLKEREVRP